MSELNPTSTPIEKVLEEKRISGVHEARTLWGRQRNDSSIRRLGWATVLNQLNGGKPMSDKELAESGQAWRCNINFRDASSALKDVLIAYWRLLHDSTNIAAVTVHDAGPQTTRYEAAFQEAFTRFLGDWGEEYVMNYLLFSFNHVGFGQGTGFWSTAKSPRWDVVRLGDIEVDERAKASVKSLTTVSILQETTVQDLWEKFRTPAAAKAAEAAGWNREVVLNVLNRHINGESKLYPVQDLIKIEDQIRNNSLFVSMQKGPIQIVHQFIKEYDGKISTYVFDPLSESEVETAGTEAKEGDKERSSGFMFDNSSIEARPESMARVLFTVFFEAGNGLFWGSKGFGQDNFQRACIQNRLKSRAVDRTILDGLNFTDETDGGLTQVPIMQAGPINVLPKGLTQVASYPTGNTILQTIEMLDNQIDSTNTRFQQNSQEVAEAPTAKQGQLVAGMQASVDVANASLFLRQVAANLFTEQFRRLRSGSDDPDAVAFKKRCLVVMTEEVFKDAEITVRTGADPGAASPAVQAGAARELVGMANDPNVDVRWAWEKYISSTFGSSAVKSALRPLDDMGDVAGTRFAMIENSELGQGIPLQVDSKDNHAVHVPAHIQPLMTMVQNYKQTQKIDPSSIVALQYAIPHLQSHFDQMQLDRTMDGLRKQLWPQFTQIRSIAEGIMSQVQQLHNQALAQRGQQPTPFTGQPPQGGPVMQAQPGGLALSGMSGAASPQQQ